MGRKWTGGPPGGPEMIWSPSRLAKIGQESLLDGRNWARVPLCGLGVVRRASRRARSGWEALSKAVSGQEAFPVGWKAFPMVWEALLVDWEALSVGRVWSGCPSSELRVV